MDLNECYKLLGVSRNFTPKELEKAFKSKVRIFHPDIEITGNEVIFKLVIQAYNELSAEYQRKTGDKQFNELKSSFKKSKNDVVLDPSRAGFNVKNFNKIFDDNRIESPHDTGYDEWLRNNPNQKEEHSIKYKGKFTNERFNNHFDRNVGQVQPSSHLVKYREPEPLLTANRIQFTELGEENIDDFSGANTSLKNLQFTDLKLSYTTERIVDPDTVEKRKTYKNVNHLEQDRANISYAMNDDEMAYYVKKQKDEEINQKKREAALKQRDDLVSRQFERINMLLVNKR